MSTIYHDQLAEKLSKTLLLPSEVEFSRVVFEALRKARIHQNDEEEVFRKLRDIHNQVLQSASLVKDEIARSMR